MFEVAIFEHEKMNRHDNKTTVVPFFSRRKLKNYISTETFVEMRFHPSNF